MDEFLQELSKKIGKHPNKEEIMADYESHVYELLNDEQISEKHIYQELVNRLGTPVEIAEMWKKDKNLTPKKTQWLFVLFNIMLFVGGAFLTVGYNVYHWNWVGLIWANLTGIPSLIMLIYMFFWGLLGYEIGKEFGHGGRKLLRRTFMIAVLPNLALMYITVFRLIPYDWFQPLLNVPFIIACIASTGILYPISLIGYRWGKKASV